MSHLKELTRNLLISMNSLPGPPSTSGRGYDPREAVKALVEELRQVDLEDFEAPLRAEFVTLRSTLADQATPRGVTNEFTLRHDALRLMEVLDFHHAPSGGEAPRDFSFLSDPTLRAIVERDYQELKQSAYPSKAWKSTVILAGSILEAVLYERLARDDQSAQAAMAAPSAPRRNGAAKDIRSDARAQEWKLDDLIKVAGEIGVLPAETVQTIHQTLREYRNLVHPKAEIRRPVPLSAGYARSSFGMLDVVLDILAAEAAPGGSP